MEDPQPLAGTHVVTADVALDVFFGARRPARCVRGTHHDDVVADGGRRVEPDIGRREIEARLIELCLQVDDAVPAE